MLLAPSPRVPDLPKGLMLHEVEIRDYTAVSYTHLDVYKRQLIGYVVIGYLYSCSENTGCIEATLFSVEILLDTNVNNCSATLSLYDVFIIVIL